MSQTLDQQRARAAWAATPERVDKEYASLCAGAAVTILTNDLGPALAFFLAKADSDGSPHRRLADALAAWLLRNGTEADPTKRGEELMQAITEAGTNTYRRYTTEALAYLNWLKRFADARKVTQD